MNSWPPTNEQFKIIADSAFNQSQKKDTKVLVYWDNPFLLIFDPKEFHDTEYLLKEYEYQDRIVKLIIGKEC